MVCGHVVVELGRMDRMVTEELEKVQVGSESQLEGTVFTVTWNAMVVLS